MPSEDIAKEGPAKQDTRGKRIVRTSIVGIAANVALAAFKAIVGVIANSIAIVLDAVNNATDALSSVVTIVGTRLAGKKPDYDHPFGHGRAEYLTAIVIGVIVMYAGVTSLVESVRRIASPEAPAYDAVGLAIIVVAVIVKVVLGAYVKRVGREVDSDSLVASGTDAQLDAVISASTVVAAVVFMATGVSLEAPLGAIISLVIIKAGVDILRETISKIIGRRVDSDLSRGIKEAVGSVPGVNGVYDLVLTDYGPDQLIGSLHVEVDENATATEIDALTRRVQELVYRRYGVAITAVGIYTTNSGSENAQDMRSRVSQMALAIDHVKEVHGFFVDEQTHDATFDVVVSFDAPDAAHVRDQVSKVVHAAFPDYRFSITLDSDFSD